jgi:hypothetical protein
MWEILITIVVCLTVVLCLALAAVNIMGWANRTRPLRHSGAGQFKTGLYEPGFKILSITGKRPYPTTTQSPTSHSKDGVAGFTTIQITENPAGICKLTGNQVKDCTCNRHRERARP